MIRFFSKQDSGNAALELVIILPVILGLVFTLVDMGRMLVADSILQTAAGKLSSKLRFQTMAERAGITSETVRLELSELINDIGAGWVKSENISVDIFKHIESEATPPSGGAGELVTYKFTYQFPPVSPTIFLLLSNSALRRIVKVTVQNEKTRG